MQTPLGERQSRPLARCEQRRGHGSGDHIHLTMTGVQGANRKVGTSGLTGDKSCDDKGPGSKQRIWEPLVRMSPFAHYAHVTTELALHRAVPTVHRCHDRSEQDHLRTETPPHLWKVGLGRKPGNHPLNPPPHRMNTPPNPSHSL